MKSLQRIEITQRTLPFAFADNVLSFYAEGAKAYWRAFGPLIQLAVQSVEVWEGWQRWYLEALEAIFVRSTMAPIKEERTPPQELGRSLLLAPLSFLGFDE
jgi:hypothetical protein